MKQPVIGNTIHDDTPPVAVHFPLKGEWFAPNTPGETIPSHGTDQLGQRFAIDLVHADDMKLMTRFLPGLRYWFMGGISMRETSGLGTPILAPLAGEVIAAKDGWPERRKATPLDLMRGLTLGLRLSEKKLRADWRQVAGNYLIIESHHAYIFLAHATTNSLRVREGDRIEEGDHLADVGNTGNSTAPHLHFHLMDGPDLWTANGLPCCFRAYEELVEGRWVRRENAIPGDKNRIRSIER